jgi:hypothetical protein
MTLHKTQVYQMANHTIFFYQKHRQTWIRQSFPFQYLHSSLLQGHAFFRAILALSLLWNCRSTISFFHFNKHYFFLVFINIVTSITKHTSQYSKGEYCILVLDSLFIEDLQIHLCNRTPYKKEKVPGRYAFHQLHQDLGDVHLWHRTP